MCSRSASFAAVPRLFPRPIHRSSSSSPPCAPLSAALPLRFPTSDNAQAFAGVSVWVGVASFAFPVFSFVRRGHGGEARGGPQNAKTLTTQTPFGLVLFCFVLVGGWVGEDVTGIPSHCIRAILKAVLVQRSSVSSVLPRCASTYMSPFSPLHAVASPFRSHTRMRACPLTQGHGER